MVQQTWLRFKGKKQQSRRLSTQTIVVDQGETFGYSVIGERQVCGIQSREVIEQFASDNKEGTVSTNDDV